jgi:predicted HicB family RNase H-like nuclease
MATPLRNIRVPDDVWTQARQKAADRGDNLSEVIRRALTEYIKNDN